MPLYLLPAVYFLQRSLSGKRLAVALGALVLVQALPGIPRAAARLARQHQGSVRAANLIVGLEAFVPEGAVLLISERSANEQVHFT